MAVTRISGIAKQIIGKFSSTPPTLTDGQYDDIRVDEKARQIVLVGKYQATPAVLADDGRDDVRLDTEARQIVAGDFKSVTLHASAAKTATFNSADFTNESFRGIKIFLEITAASGTTPTLDIKLQDKDALSGVYVDITGAAFAQKTGTGSDALIIYPGIAETANESVSDLLIDTYRFVATITGTTPTFTFSLGAVLLP